MLMSSCLSDSDEGFSVLQREYVAVLVVVVVVVVDFLLSAAEE